METAFPKTFRRTAIYTVLGADTYLGAHMMRHLQQKGQMLVGFAQDEDFDYDAKSLKITDVDKISEDIPDIDSEWVVICLDPSMGFEKYIVKLKKIFAGLAAHEFVGDICFFSSATICMADMDQPISENTVVYSRNEHDLALATGENLLTVLGCSEKGYAAPHVMRIGVPYGDEIGMESSPGFVNDMVVNARNRSPLQIPMGGEAKRSLTHISDICESAIALMNSDYCPPLVNIPGEVKTITDVGSAISSKYNVAFTERGLNRYDDLNYFAGDQYLSEKLFNDAVKFSPKYTFEQWLNEKSLCECSMSM